MKWAFWRRDGARNGAPAADATRATDLPERGDPAAALKLRARRRLVGAAALLLAAVVIVPMVLDPAPRPVADNIPIEIPGEKTPFLPRLPLPPDPAQTQAGPPPDAAAPAAAGDAKADAPASDKAAAKDLPKPAPKSGDKAASGAAAGFAAKSERADDGQRARDLLEGRDGKSGGGHVLQVAALGSEKAAAGLGARLRKSGYPVFTERVQAKEGPRWRVRVGPFASRTEADQARARLREDGVTASLVPPER